jgi:cysteine desulfurase family protein (TIGR01976 family)
MDTLTTPRPTTAFLAKVRSAFPALERRHQGYPVAYFDGPGGTQVPQSVVDAMADYLLHHNANTHWQYPTSAETDALIASSRRALADLLGARPTEIAFGANMTTLTFHLSRALGRSWGRGDTIVVTELDHHANIAPWRALERERGVTIATVPLIPRTGQLDWERLEALLEARPKLLAIGAASNALGTVNDIRRASELARQHGAMTFVDAVHYVPHHLTDVRALGCDFLACSAYKFCGPHIGVLFAREEILQQLDVPKLAPAPDTAPERIETGTLNHEGIIGAAAAVDFFASLSQGSTRRDRLVQTYQELHVRGRALVERLWFGLQEIRGVTVYGPAPDLPRTPTVAFTLAGQPADAVAHRLAGLALFVSSGDFYAATVVERLGVAEGLVRVGCACYTSEEEVERLVQGVRSLSRE